MVTQRKRFIGSDGSTEMVKARRDEDGTLGLDVDLLMPGSSGEKSLIKSQKELAGKALFVAKKAHSDIVGLVVQFLKPRTSQIEAQANNLSDPLSYRQTGRPSCEARRYCRA